MEPIEPTYITVQATVNAPKETVWNKWTTPEDIVMWNAASDDWHTTSAVSDLHAGGRFSYRMESRDWETGFDFSGVYDRVVAGELIEVTLDDARKVTVRFSGDGDKTEVVETFEAENENTIELQRFGWQAILDSFKKYTETS